MTEEPLKGEISPLSQEFTDEQVTVGVMIYKCPFQKGVSDFSRL